MVFIRLHLLLVFLPTIFRGDIPDLGMTIHECLDCMKTWIQDFLLHLAVLSGTTRTNSRVSIGDAAVNVVDGAGAGAAGLDLVSVQGTNLERQHKVVAPGGKPRLICSIGEEGQVLIWVVESIFEKKETGDLGPKWRGPFY